jgi:hemerythrin-like metal-binding protein
MSSYQYSMLPQNLRTNIHEIDYEHNELFVFLEGFKRYCFASDPLPQAKRDALLQMLASHFETEDNFAKNADIEFSHHERAHINMLDVVLKSLNQMSTKNSDLYGLIRYINYWFEKHILMFDLSLAQNITKTN